MLFRRVELRRWRPSVELHEPEDSFASNQIPLHSLASHRRMPATVSRVQVLHPP